MFYLGGNTGKANIEVHDIQFVAAQKQKDACLLKEKLGLVMWTKYTLMGYSRITWTDGMLSYVPATVKNKLFFVNVGAYKPSTLAELHAFDLFVAPNAHEAKAKTLTSLLTDAQHQHKDNIKKLDDCLLLDKVIDLYVHGSRHQTEVLLLDLNGKDINRLAVLISIIRLSSLLSEQSADSEGNMVNDGSRMN